MEDGRARFASAAFLLDLSGGQSQDVALLGRGFHCTGACGTNVCKGLPWRHPALDEEPTGEKARAPESTEAVDDDAFAPIEVRMQQIVFPRPPLRFPCSVRRAAVYDRQMYPAGLTESCVCLFPHILNLVGIQFMQLHECDQATRAPSIQDV